MRRTCRYFSDALVMRAMIEAADTAPSGANRQPWHFAVISSPALKKTLKQIASRR